MKTNFKLMTDKIGKDGLCPIFVRSKHNGKELKYFTGEKCRLEEWDIDSQKVKRINKNYKNINECLDKIARDIGVFLHDSKLKGFVPSVEDIKIAITPKIEVEVIEEKEKDVIEVYDEFIEWSVKEGKKHATIKVMKVTRNHLNEFHKVELVRIDDFTEDVYNRFIAFLMSRFNQQPNSIGNQTKNLKTFFYWCRDKKFMKLSEKHAKLSVISIDGEKIYLTREEIEKFKAVELNERLSHVRDSFLFGCYTGLRYSDLKKLVSASIQEVNGTKIVSFTPQKTNSFYKKTRKKVNVALIPDALAIIEKYSESHENTLPVISNQKMNDYLKEIGKMAGIIDKVEKYRYVNNEPVLEYVPKWKLISCHVARHTFATQSISRGVAAAVVQKLLGHSSIKTTMIYAKIVEDYQHTALLDAWKD
jgi:integrase/recombinase XerD